MMLSERRRSKRFDRSLFVQFRQLRGLASYTLGLTLDVSGGGLCFQFQNIALENGDNLEFQIKKPMTNSSVRVLGDVIWTQKKGTKCTAGIKFQVANKKNKKEMLRTISDFFTIPVDLLHHRQGTKRSIRKVRSKKSVTILDDAEEKDYSKKTLVSRGFKMIITIGMITLITVMLVLFMPLILKNHEDATEHTVAPFIQTASYDNSNDNLSMLVSKIRTQHENINNQFNSETENIVEENKNEGLLEEGIKTTEQENKADVIKNFAKRERLEKFNFFVQVASLRDPDIAYNMLLKIKRNYPEAYFFKINNLYRIRIPGIHTEKQGAGIIKELREKLDIESTLVFRLK